MSRQDGGGSGGGTVNLFASAAVYKGSTGEIVVGNSARLEDFE